MEEGSGYVVDITPEAEIFYYDLLKYLYSTHSKESADRKSDEILNIALSLDRFPNQGRVEDKLITVEAEKKVFATDFFPTEMDDSRIIKRNR